ncbi:hypothetical protein BP6252_11473 [Coleophoma cylindrospora]|uniref:Uncharacterized protein n=1 Tax=Coleophoma cylindrospora TaxID=1849047 RepID=A0A3D8QK42_9HELO|nr:hypothetical protein BP6252_11473 [Coleophoma cylindrospora]
MAFAVIPNVHVCIACHHDDESLEAPKPNMIMPYIDEDIHPASGMAMSPMSGVRCPSCLARGQEVWVIPGRACGYCGTGC